MLPLGSFEMVIRGECGEGRDIGILIVGIKKEKVSFSMKEVMVLD